MPTFEKMRISLAREEDAGLLSSVEDNSQYLPRSDYLEAVFGLGHHKFLKDSTTYTYTPIEAPDGFAAGFFARERQVELRHEDLSNY